MHPCGGLFFEPLEARTALGDIPEPVEDEVMDGVGIGPRRSLVGTPVVMARADSAKKRVVRYE